jgi:transposase
LSTEPSQFSHEFKLEILRRMDAGANVSALAREFGVSRKSIYHWRHRFRLGGSYALRNRGGRKTKAEVAGEAAHETPIVRPPSAETPVRQTSLEELGRSQRRIAALERKVGQQQVELDFFQQALRRVREERQRSGGPGETVSTKSSKP